MESFIVKSNCEEYFPNRVTMFNISENDKLFSTLDIVIKNRGLKVHIYFTGYELGKNKPIPSSIILNSSENESIFNAFSFLSEETGNKIGNRYCICGSCDNGCMFATKLPDGLQLEMGEGKSQGIWLYSEELAKDTSIDDKFISSKLLEEFECMLINSSDREYYKAKREFFNRLKQAKRNARVKAR